jgi:hypothetical protein
VRFLEHKFWVVDWMLNTMIFWGSVVIVVLTTLDQYVRERSERKKS